ncbi:MAG TPA: hypothetical protein VML50_04970 [Anaeromyxobacter sp.]|nr:hypothetical protein [Anaeromyxobacter sp.]
MRRTILLSATLLCACAPSFDPASYVKGIRVLAVKAEPAEVAPGQSTTLSALAVDTSGATVQAVWIACTEPAVTGSGPVNPDCFGPGTAPYLVPLGTGLTLDATIPAVAPADFGPPDAGGGVYLPIVVRASSASGAVTGEYGLRLAQGAPPNQNPTLSDVVVVAGATLTPLDPATPLEVHAGDQLTLRGEFAPGSAETYQTVVSGVPSTVTEILRVSWFASGGSLSEAVTGGDKPDTVWTADTHLPPAGSIIDLWVVGRDERGGTDFTHRQLVLR